MSGLSAYLAGQKKKFLLERKQAGGRAAAFREFVGQQYQTEPDYFLKMVLDALMEATTKAWERQPRRKGPDLFSVAGFTIPEFLTRPADGYVSAEDIEDDNEAAFEKVDHEFATVQDFLDDATIKMRKAAQSAAAAEREMKAVDAARRRARGNMSALLVDIADAADDDDLAA